MYDAQSVMVPNAQIGKRAHLLNILGSHINTFVGIAPPSEHQPSFPIIQSGFSYNHLWQQTSLPRVLFSQRPDIFLSPFNTAPLCFPRQTRLLLVVHDLIPFEWYPNVRIKHRALLTYWRYLTAASIRQASLVITVSDYSRGQILSYFPSARVVVLKNTIAESWYVRKNSVPDLDRDNYLIMVTSMNPHKNIDRALQAYSRYVKKVGVAPAHLRIVGLSPIDTAKLRPRLHELAISDHVSFLSYLSPSELQTLYRGARALFVPSLSEGFGIPVLEAMASGTPVISSSATCLPEVGGSAPEYFDPRSVSDMYEALTRVLSDGQLRASMIERGLLQAEIFHPNVVLRQAREFWDDLPNLVA